MYRERERESIGILSHPDRYRSSFSDSVEIPAGTGIGAARGRGEGAGLEAAVVRGARPVIAIEGGPAVTEAMRLAALEAGPAIRLVARPSERQPAVRTGQTDRSQPCPMSTIGRTSVTSKVATALIMDAASSPTTIASCAV